MTTPRLRVDSSAKYLRAIANGDITAPQEVVELLTKALGAKDYAECVKDLPSHNIDPQSYIDELDKAINILTPESDIHERCVRALRKTCGVYGLLPDSHEVKFVLTAGEHAVASGGFSDIWKATDEDGEVFAVKVLRMYQNNAAQKYCREVIISKRMNHPNILQIEGVAPGLFPCCMVSRWMENGNLLEYLNRNQAFVDRLDLLRGVIRGLNYLHKHQVVHGDLKSYNILINEFGAPCLADFGLSSIAEDIYSMSGSNAASGGSVRWSAPELVGSITARQERWVHPTTQSDIYSLAMVIVEVFTGKIPFPDAINVQVIILMSKGDRPSKPPGVEALGLVPALWKLTEECWHQSPERRPDIANVLRRFQAIVEPGLFID
ncbi:kinase-like domain-containing protein [Thelephora terrestris]|uniref:Kinase-like domain-containing protein n=1 Tax=Thelephora terrestris TaxID=56493 RepID=A0A9P6LA61_9AGAM|nr:kinase-like domain-containing protein [Thelephora terrestris]